MNIFITGSNGFIGKRLSEVALKENFQCTLSMRNHSGDSLNNDNLSYVYRTIASNTDWSGAFSSIDCVIHTAALVHQMNGADNNHYQDINTYGTLNLAQQAAGSGVKRFIFISTIKVNGEHTAADLPFKPNDSYVPCDPYGLSKYEAEVGLRKIAKDTGIEVVIIRPPLVYGPGVKGNFASMMRWLSKALPLPLGAIHNKRSLVALDNLVDLIVTCVNHPNAANETFLVSDDEDVSTSELLSKLGEALGGSSRLLPIPEALLEFFAKLLGKHAVAQRLLGSLQVDITKTKEQLNWAPPFSVDESLKKTAQYYLEHQ